MSGHVIAPGVPFEEPPPRPTPLLPLALGLIGGILLDNFFHLSTWLSISLLVAGAIVHGKLRRRSAAATTVALILAAAGLGSLRHAVHDRWLPANHVAHFTADDPILAGIRGRLISPPRVSEPPKKRPTSYAAGPTTRFILEAAGIESCDGPIDVTGRIAVTVGGAVLDLCEGDLVEMRGWLSRPRGPRNPGEFDWALHNRRNGIRARMSCQHPESIRRLRPADAFSARTILNGIRARVRGLLLDDAFRDGDPGEGVMAAMVIGERSAVSKAMNNVFVHTGNAHFLAASGLHVGLLSMLGWWFMTRCLGVHYRTAALAVILLLLSFVVLAEPRPSILRAGIVGVLACVAVYIRRGYNSLNWLSCAAMVILLINPADLFDSAFQFSFLAVLALLYLQPAVGRAISAKLAARNRFMAAWYFDRKSYAASLVDQSGQDPLSTRGFFRLVCRSSVQLLLCAFSAWLVTIPLACYHFDRFAPWGPLSTLVMSLVAIPAIWAGYAKVLLGAMFPSSGILLGPILQFLTECMLTVAQLLAKLPGTPLDGHSPNATWIVAVYCAVTTWTFRPGWIRSRHGYTSIAIVLAVIWLIPPGWVRSNRNALNVWMLAIGDGTATVIELPDGRVMVYDFGTRSNFDAAAVGESFLKHRGIHRLDTVFVSHANFDHYGAVTQLAEKLEIGRVVINDHFESFSEKGAAAARFLGSLRKIGVPIEIMRGPQTFSNDDGLTIESIWPPPLEEQRFIDANDSSTVLRIIYQNKSILLTGDIEEFAMAKLIARGDIEADALALPHHGSVVAATGPFITAVNPENSIRSSGQRSVRTINGIEAFLENQRYYNTADVGCVLVKINDGELTAGALGEK